MISVMLFICSGCIDVVTIYKETALHLAVKNNQAEATKVIVDWARDEQG